MENEIAETLVRLSVRSDIRVLDSQFLSARKTFSSEDQCPIELRKKLSVFDDHCYFPYRKPYSLNTHAAIPAADDSQMTSDDEPQSWSYPKTASMSSKTLMDDLCAAASINSEYNFQSFHSPLHERSHQNNGASFTARYVSPTSTKHINPLRHRRHRSDILNSYNDSDSGHKQLGKVIRMDYSNFHHNRSQSFDSLLFKPDSFSGSSIHSYVGSYSPKSRKERIERFLQKRKRRIWTRKVDYNVRKNFANSRLRVKGRFVRKEDEELLCQLLSFT